MPTIQLIQRYVILSEDNRTILSYFRGAMREKCSGREVFENLPALLGEETEVKGIIAGFARAVESKFDYALKGKRILLPAVSLNRVFDHIEEIYTRVYRLDTQNQLEEFGVPSEERGDGDIKTPQMFVIELLRRLIALAISDDSHVYKDGAKIIPVLTHFVGLIMSTESPLGQERRADEYFRLRYSRLVKYLGDRHGCWVEYFQNYVRKSQLIQQDTANLNSNLEYFKTLRKTLYSYIAVFHDPDTSNEEVSSEDAVYQKFSKTQTALSSAFDSLPLSERKALTMAVKAIGYQTMMVLLKPAIQENGFLAEELSEDEACALIQETFFSEESRLPEQEQNALVLSSIKQAVCRENAMVSSVSGEAGMESRFMPQMIHLRALKAIMRDERDYLKALAMIQKKMPQFCERMLYFYLHLYQVEQCISFTRTAQSYFEQTGLLGILSNIIDNEAFITILDETFRSAAAFVKRVPMEELGAAGNILLQRLNELREIGDISGLSKTKDMIESLHDNDRLSVLAVVAERFGQLSQTMLDLNTYFGGQVLRVNRIHELTGHIETCVQAASTIQTGFSKRSLPSNRILMLKDRPSDKQSTREILPAAETIESIRVIHSDNRLAAETVKTASPQRLVQAERLSYRLHWVEKAGSRDISDSEDSEISDEVRRTAFHHATGNDKADAYPNNDDSNIIFGQDGSNIRWMFQEKGVPGDGDCGFHCLGISRETIVNMLLAQAEDMEIRRILSPEIREAIVNGHLQDLPDPGRWEGLLASEAEANHVLQTVRERIEAYLPELTSTAAVSDERRLGRLYKLGQRGDQTAFGRRAELKMAIDKTHEVEAEIQAYCQEISLFRTYAACYRRDLWLGIHTIECYAREMELRIIIWHCPDSRDREQMLRPDYDDLFLYRDFDYSSDDQSKLICLLFNGTHYNLLDFVATEPITISSDESPKSDTLPMPQSSDAMPLSSQQPEINDEEAVVSSEDKPADYLPGLTQEQPPVEVLSVDRRADDTNIVVPEERQSPPLPPEFELTKCFLLEDPQFFPLIFWAQGFGNAALLLEKHEFYFSVRLMESTREALNLHYKALSRFVEDVLADFTDETEFELETLMLLRHFGAPKGVSPDKQTTYFWARKVHEKNLSPKERSIYYHRKHNGGSDNEQLQFVRFEALLSADSTPFESGSERLRNWKDHLKQCFDEACDEVIAQVEVRLKAYPGFSLLTPYQIEKEEERYRTLIRDYKDKCFAHYSSSLSAIENKKDEGICSMRQLLGEVYCYFYSVFSAYSIYYAESSPHHAAYVHNTQVKNHEINRRNKKELHHGIAQWLFDAPLDDAKWPEVWQRFLQTAPLPAVEYPRALTYLERLLKAEYISPREKSRWERHVHDYYQSADSRIDAEALMAAYPEVLTPAALHQWKDVFWWECRLLQNTESKLFESEWETMLTRLEQRLLPLALKPFHLFTQCKDFPDEAQLEHWKTDWEMYFHYSWLAWHLALYPELKNSKVPLSRKVTAAWTQALRAFLQVFPESFFKSLNPSREGLQSGDEQHVSLAGWCMALPAFFVDEKKSAAYYKAQFWMTFTIYYAFYCRNSTEHDKRAAVAFCRNMLTSMDCLSEVEGKPLVVETLKAMVPQRLLLRADEEGETLLHHVMRRYPAWLNSHKERHRGNRLACQDELLALGFLSHPHARNHEGKLPQECIPVSFSSDKKNINLLQILRKTFIQAVNETQSGYTMTVTKEMSSYVKNVMKAVWSYLQKEPPSGMMGWFRQLYHSPLRLDEAFQYLTEMLRQEAIFNAMKFDAEIQAEAIREEAIGWQLISRSDDLHDAVKQETDQVKELFKKQRDKIGSELWQPEENMKTMQEEVSKSREKAKKLVEENAVLTQKVVKLEKEVLDARQEVSDARQEASDARQEASDARQEASDARQEASDAHRRLDEVEGDMQFLKSALRRMGVVGEGSRKEEEKSCKGEGMEGYGGGSPRLFG